MLPRVAVKLGGTVRKSPDVWLIGLFDSEPHLLPEFCLSTCPSLSHVHFPSVLPCFYWLRRWALPLGLWDYSALPDSFRILLGLLVSGGLVSICEFCIQSSQLNGSSLLPFITQIQTLAFHHTYVQIEALTCWEVQWPTIARPDWELRACMFCQGSDI